MIRWIYRTYPPEKILGLHYKRFPMAPHCFDSHFCDKNRENIDFTSPVEKEGLANGELLQAAEDNGFEIL